MGQDFVTGGGGEHSHLTGSGISRSLEVGMEVKREGKASRERDAGIGHETTVRERHDLGLGGRIRRLRQCHPRRP